MKEKHRGTHRAVIGSPDLTPTAYVPSDNALPGAVTYIVPDVLLPDEEEFGITVDYPVQ